MYYFFVTIPIIVPDHVSRVW